jgi:LysM repeat protein
LTGLTLLAIITIPIHFQKQAEGELKKLIYLIFLFFLISGCSGTLRLAKELSDSSVSNPDAMLASIRIPDPSETIVSAAAENLESSAPSLPAVTDFSSIDTWTWSTGTVLFFLRADPGDGESKPLLSQKTDPFLFEPIEPNKIVSTDKKRTSAPPKTAKASSKPSRHELPAPDPGVKKGEDSPSLENLREVNASEALSLTDLQEPGSRRQDFFAQPEGNPLLPALPVEFPVEPPFPGNLSSAVGSAVTIFPSLVNEKVKGFVSFFQGRAESFFSRSLARSLAYEEMMKRIFREKNLPEELFYLALIESGYNPTALSRAKASGIWQFVAQTAKRYGLRVDKWVDERRDPEKSTYAAAEYLKTLHGLFNSWDLAAAGYNAGEGKVMRAMKNTRSNDFWEISESRHLKLETKKYVPMFLAAVTIAKEPQKYGFTDIAYYSPLVYEKVKVPPSTSLALIAKAAETDLSEIRSLNPALIREKTPPNSPSFDIKVPMGKKEAFEKNFSLLSNIPSAGKKSQHNVCSGETLTRVAKKYRVSLQDLCTANGISPNSPIKPGSTLKIPH